MPKPTFFNLPEEKRKQIIDECFREFSLNAYEQASITTIVNRLGIAKGSIYQYFENKKELWVYLKEKAEQTKMQFIKDIDRNSFKDFWSYYRALYANGIQFDLKYPDQSLFLYKSGTSENSPEVKEYLDGWKKKAGIMFEKWVEHEKKTGGFNKKLPTKLIVHTLLTMSLSIKDLLEDQFGLDFEKNIRSGKSLFGKNEKEIMEAVDQLILIMKKALE